MTKLSEELHHILGEVAHPSPAFCGIGEFGSYVVGLIYSLACTERAFDLIPLSHGLGHQGLPLGTGRFQGRPSKWLAVVFDLQVFEYSSVGLVHIDLVCKDGGRQTITMRAGLALAPAFWLLSVCPYIFSYASQGRWSPSHTQR